MYDFTPTDLDQRIWAEELDGFVPERVFDVHTHIYRWAFNLNPDKETGPYAPSIGRYFPEVTTKLADEIDAALLPGRKVERLAFPFPFAGQCDFDGSNTYVANEAARSKDSAALMLVHPGMSEAEILATLKRTGAIGLKPYLVYATNADRAEAGITDFLPEHQIALADRLGLIVMMHLSKRRAISDPDNISEMLRLSEKYPRVRWILAHCARSYSAWAIEKAAASLRGLPNVWYDTSTVCEADALDALYDGVGVDRVMYGSDDMIGPMRGKYIAFGFAWAFLSETNHQLSLGHCDPRMTYIRYEQLRAMKRGARQLGLSTTQREALFHDTARGLVDAARTDVHAFMRS
ncbi:amidohydrolase family protein [Devosia sp.]|uniref:amidohydrolase family protein n=1 Tax=Devosia sp. TaxID=1871048 RepID=UPI0025E2EC7B|nr:amidohydrolase family protein [Devosia sp.]MCR6636573.1 amidohydrolase [Devosia sp.]